MEVSTRDKHVVRLNIIIAATSHGLSARDTFTDE